LWEGRRSTPCFSMCISSSQIQEVGFFPPPFDTNHTCYFPLKYLQTLNHFLGGGCHFSLQHCPQPVDCGKQKKPPAPGWHGRSPRSRTTSSAERKDKLSRTEQKAAKIPGAQLCQAERSFAFQFHFLTWPSDSLGSMWQTQNHRITEW